MFVRCVLMAAFLVSSHLSSMDSVIKPEESLKLRIMTYNTCNFWGMADKAETAHLTWDARKDRIIRLILDEKPDIVGFQELRDDNEKSTLKDLWLGLADHGYRIESVKHNPSPGSYINVIAYNSNKLMSDNVHRWWLSETPDKCSDSWGNGWGNAALMVSLYPIIKQKKGNFDVSFPDYTRPVHVANVHNGLKHQEKMKTNIVLVNEIDRRTQGSKGVVILTGDFNSFPEPERGGAIELAILKDAGYSELLNDLKTKNGIAISGTFIGYSSDRFQCPTGTLSGQLDHIFLKNLSNVAFGSKSYVNMKKYNGKDKEDATTQAELLMGPDGKEVRDEFPSDHVPGIVDLEILFNIAK